MRERPILFSGPMVRAILSGQKMQTRRIAKDVRHPDLGNVYTPGALAREPQHVVDRCCPYGQPGDRLWVRETWKPCGLTARRISVNDRRNGKRAYYAADGRKYIDPSTGKPSPWRPSIHMPRWASRITLEITGVLVERLQDISEHDAQAEGCSLECMTSIGNDSGSAIYGPNGFMALWESINGPGSWGTNPWVWVVEFKQIQT